MISREATAKSHYITVDADWKINDTPGPQGAGGHHRGRGLDGAPVHRRSDHEPRRRRQLDQSRHQQAVDWSVGGDSNPSGVTGFGTWGNQQVTALDTEDWITVDFTQDTDVGVLNSVDFGVRYADHKREAQSPEGASPGDIWSDLQNGTTAAYPGDFASGIGGNFPRALWYFTPGAMQRGHPGQLHLAVRQRRPERSPQLRR